MREQGEDGRKRTRRGLLAAAGGGAALGTVVRPGRASASASGFLFPGTAITRDELAGQIGVDAREYAQAGPAGDWTAAIQQAVRDTAFDPDTGQFTRRRVLLPARLRLTDGVLLDAQTAALRGAPGGSVIDASAITDGATIRVAGSGEDERVGTQPWRQSLRSWVSGISLIGPGAEAAGSTGIELDTPVLPGRPSTAHGELRNLAVQDFGTGIAFGNNAYAVLLETVTVFSCGTAVLLREAQNAGESIRLHACGMFECGRGLVCENRGADAVLVGCSLDYCDEALLSVERGRVLCLGAHLETDRPGPWFVLGKEDGATLALQECELVVAGGPRATPLGGVPAEVGLGGLHLSGGRVVFAAPPRAHVLVDGEGPVRAAQAPSIRRGNPEEGLPPLARQLSLVPGDFESAAEIAAWRLTGAVGDSSRSARGQGSLRLEADGGQRSPSARVDAGVLPGQTVAVSLRWRRAGEDAPTGIEVRWTRGGRLLPGTPAARLAADPPPDAFASVLLPGSVVPPGADGLELAVGAASPWRPGARVWIDDVVLTAR